MPKPNLTTARVPLANLKPWDGNARRGIVSEIKESMRINGVFQPLIVQASTMRIIAGNHRHAALTELHTEDPTNKAWGPDVDIITVDVDDARALKMHLADNKTSDDASWDFDALANQLRDLTASDEGIIGSGFEEDEIEEILAGLDEAEDPTLPGVEPDDGTVTRTFTLTEDQATIVDAALDTATNQMDGTEGNDKAAALTYICLNLED